MKRVSSIFGSSALAVLFVVSAAGAAAQGKPAHAPRAGAGHRAASQPSGGAFRGIAEKLGTTPDALESAYQAAKQANPELKRGQFVSANMVAHNLSEKHPTITTQAILDGLKSGKSLGQVLQGSGLSASEAEEAERQADRDVKAAVREGPKEQH
ncbi:MAG TPA: hypothetical protein VM736_11685 [Gemmatimonadales bacterium]|nr:hypothetical protein [Gemmatimonadales bacterium]